MTMASFRLICFLLITSSVFAEDQCSLLCASGVCCQGSNGKLLCCPTPNGVCCKSGDFCCPQGTVCGSDGSCTKAQTGFFAFIKSLLTPHSPPIPTEAISTKIPTEAPPTTPAVKAKPNLDSCPSVCGENCCPHLNGVCCGDGEHCCPSGYTCDISTKSCRLSPEEMAADLRTDNQSCSLDNSQCNSGETCCIMYDGNKGCCPYDHADCCSDGFHCCPRGFKCSPGSDACLPAWGAWVNPFEPSSRELVSRKPALECPDGKSGCTKGSTCCKTSNSTGGGYACCPLENAVCCSDGEHCCPQGHVCDPNGGTCVQQSQISIVPPPRKAAAPEVSVTDHKCDDGRSTCPDKMTCCPGSDGFSSCCPMPNAVCCEDHEHCCPHGYKCDVLRRMCVREQGDLQTTPMSKKVTSGLFSNKTHSPCDDGATACSVNGVIGCCPLGNAVCCPDGLHCCENGYTCNNDGRCLKNGILAQAPRLLDPN